ncbi:MAG: glycosyltransferase family 2 protein [Chloroflexi bacterium]|nr:glycosyltransferase family 2 protein [Chloroflexota bacterium]
MSLAPAESTIADACATVGDTRPVVSVVIVTWNNLKVIDRCLMAVQAAQGEVALDTFVVDNASTDGTPDHVSEHYPWVALIREEENRGFSQANNVGLARAQGRYVLLLNPDAFLDRGALSILCTFLDEHPDVAVAGPQLLNEDGTVQSSRRRAPTRLTGFYESTQLQQWFGNNALTDHYYVGDVPDYLLQEVEWVTGACMLIRGEAIERVGALDPEFHMYSEELEWCLRFRKSGWKVMYVPEARVTHLVGQSSGQDVLQRHYNHHQSKLRLYALLYGRAWSLLLRMWIAGLYTLQIVEESGKYVLTRRNRAVRRFRLQLLIKMLLWLVLNKGIETS